MVIQCYGMALLVTGSPIDSNNANCVLTAIGLVHSLAIKAPSGKLVFLQMRPWQLQHLQTIQRTYLTRGVPNYC